jgi:glycosyltransferase involved in cell wall biosynthesis
VSSDSRRKTDAFVTAVAPVINDYAAMSSFVHETSAMLAREYTNYELILVDGGAGDESVESVIALTKELPCIRIIRLSQKANTEVVVFAGLEAAIGDYVVVLTPSIDPPKAVKDLVEIMRRNYDIIYGLSESPPPRTRAASLGARLFYWYGRKYLGLNIPPNSTYLVGLNRRSINALTRIKGRYRHVRHLTRQVGFKTAVYRYTPLAGAATHRRGLLRSLQLANEIVVSYSQHPLRVASRVGLIASSLNLVYALYAIGVFVFAGHVSEGWTTLSLELAAMFFILFIILSVLCEYTGRILEETRMQPAYHIMEEINSTVLVADGTRRNVLKEA